MSFITKRERVFNEYDLFDLPARNEGKLKAYASCTDARAWSHFCSDKSEHLVEIIKRNNETVRTKYIPTDVIVNTLMTAKNAEITRLKRRIEEFEQLLSAYDQLDLTCDQKCDIANAHAAIKAANQELDEMVPSNSSMSHNLFVYLDLDLSSFTEGIDSEAFETGKSRGDEPSKYTDEVKTKGDENEKSGGDELKWAFETEKESTPRKETKGSQTGTSCICDASTSAHDPQVVEMQETIISKDAKLNAMQNTIAVMEHDICEPYCIYAHIYTALEKIFGILCQNMKYKQYLDLLTAGKDTRGIDIKGKILFKIKVLEKFSLALIAPCSQDFSRASQECSCYHVELVTQVETTFALTSAENQKPSLDNKRAQLVADIMDNQEMKEILSKESVCLKVEGDQFDEHFGVDNYSVDVENLNRIKNLQANYEELLTCYDNLKHERDCLYLKCQTFSNLENECDCLKNKLREYNELWKEKEFYQKRSEDLDTLKENYLILSEETSNIETKFKAEQEITKNKSGTIDELRNENIKLEQKVVNASLVFEKEKNVLVCKLKECECKMMCQKRQINSLSSQIDKLLEQDTHKIPSNDDALRTVQLIAEIESQKEQIHNLKDALCCSEDEKQYIKEEFEQKLDLINNLKYNIEDWKSKYEKALINSNYLEKYLDDFQVQVKELQGKHVLMNEELENKTNAIENLNNILGIKSQEINNLIEERDHKNDENMVLINEIKTVRNMFDTDLAVLINERKVIMNSIIAAKQQSEEMFKNLKDKDNSKHIEQTMEKEILYKSNSSIEMQIIEENINQIIDKHDLVKEIELLQEINISNVKTLLYENAGLKNSLHLAKEENERVEENLINQENLLQRYENLKETNQNLLNENGRLETKLNCSLSNFDIICKDFELSKKTSQDLLEKSDDIKEKYMKLTIKYEKLLNKNNILQKDINDKESKRGELGLAINALKLENDNLSLHLQEIKQLKQALIELQGKYSDLAAEKSTLQTNISTKTQEIKKLYNELETKIEENQFLHDQIKSLQIRELSCTSNISELKNENYNMQLNLKAVKTESGKLFDKIKELESLENDNNNLKLTHNRMKLEKENLMRDLNTQISDFKKLQQENYDLNNHNKNLLIHSESLETALIKSRNENLSRAGSISDLYNNIKKEMESLKEQKLNAHERIKILMDKLDESDWVITNLTEDIIARDKRIATLENHINELEVEIRALQKNLVEVVESGEQLKQLSCEKLDLSLKKLEAQKSKATHNMKMELVKLQNEKENLKGQLSNTKTITEGSLQENHNYKLLIDQHQRERELIISDIKQLEIKLIGDSSLSVTCSINDVITSLKRLGKCIDSKNISLEQTLAKVQASYQLLKSKADEAKNIAEMENEKIACEREQQQKERMKIEKQLEELKVKLKNEKINYEKLIKDVQGEALNQKLIFNKLKQTSENHILKLKEEKNSLQSKCDKLCTDIKELKEKLKYTSEQKLESNDIINNIKKTLEEKNLLIIAFQKQLENMKNKPLTKESEVQTISSFTINIMCQTDIDNGHNYNKKKVEKSLPRENVPEDVKLLDKYTDKYHEFNISRNKISHKSNNLTNLLSSIESSPVHEVQILTANVEPTIDFIKNIYLKYKIKRLSPGKLEQYSIASLDDTNILDGPSPSYNLPSETRFTEILLPKNPNFPTNLNNNSIIDIYDTQISTNSTKITDDIYTNISKEHKHPLINIESNDEGFNNFNHSYIKDRTQKKSSGINHLFQSTEKDLFVIYKDGETIYDKDTPKIFEITSVTVKTKENMGNIQQKIRLKTTNQSDTDDHINSPDHISDERDDDSIKPRLKINLPRVINDSPSTITTFDIDKRSSESYTHDIYASPKRDVYSDPKVNINRLEMIEANIVSVHSASRNDLMQEIFPENRFSKEIVENHPLENYKFKETRITGDRDKNNVFSTQSSNNNLSRPGANVLILQNTTNHRIQELAKNCNVKSNYGLEYILKTVQKEMSPDNTKNVISSLNKSHSEKKFLNRLQSIDRSNQSKQFSALKMTSIEYETMSTNSPVYMKSVSDRGILVKLDAIEDYENKIQQLTKALENIEKAYKKKIDAVKIQYDSNIKSIINEHDHGVQSIQNLHEETLKDMRKNHENEAENLRTMSIEALRKAETLEIENRYLKAKRQDNTSILDEEPVKIRSPDLKRRRCKCRVSNKTLTKTNVEAFNVKPIRRLHGPCTCSPDLNISDTIRNIFEQVDVEQRKLAEQAYLKYIANKILDGNVETLDSQELSFLHLKVCRTWKTKLNKEAVLQKKIDSLENELISKQRQTQKHMAELDRKVAEEWRRLQEVREAVCRNSPVDSRDSSPGSPNPISTAEKDKCNCNTASCNITVRERRSAGDLVSGLSGAVTAGGKRKRGKLESNRAVLAKLDGCEGRREKVSVCNETPTRLKRAHDRHNSRVRKK